MTAEDRLVIHEIYTSIQGESTFAGLPCVFVRLTGCDLRCVWCDTTRAFHEGRAMRLDDVVAAALEPRIPLIEVTGGEPLLQRGTPTLLRRLCDAGHTVLLETSGAADVSSVDARVHKIMDLKAPGSGESRRNRWENLAHLGRGDEIKFVLADRPDYEWMRDVIRERELEAKVGTLLASCAFGVLDPRELVRWVLEDQLRVRVQLQLHKYIWGASAEGV